MGWLSWPCLERGRPGCDQEESTEGKKGLVKGKSCLTGPLD